jgi:hypothetical protein
LTASTGHSASAARHVSAHLDLLACHRKLLLQLLAPLLQRLLLSLAASRGGGLGCGGLGGLRAGSGRDSSGEEYQLGARGKGTAALATMPLGHAASLPASMACSSAD